MDLRLDRASRPDRAPGEDAWVADDTVARQRAGTDYAEMMARYLGPVVMTALADDDVTEVYVNPHDGRLRLDTHRTGRVDTPHVVPAARLEMFLNAVATAQGTTLGSANPQLQAELPTERFAGARLQGFLPPATPGVAITIRKRPTRVYTLDDYVARGALSPCWRAALRTAVRERWTIVVCGPTGAGKSTLANALLQEIADSCPDERLAVLEDTVELQCRVPDYIALRTTATLSLAALVKATLRTSPTRIVIGEVRDASALDFLDAAATGHPGGICTVHASSARGALERLDRLAQRANVPSQRALIADAVQLVVVMANGGATAVDPMQTVAVPDIGTTSTSPPPRRRVLDLVRVTGLARDAGFVLYRCSESGTWEPC